MNRRTRIAVLSASALAALAAPVAGQRPALAMLDELEKGAWELRIREQGATTERVCLPDARRLIQLRHPGGNCDRLVVQDTPSAVTVQYTCRGQGYGRTQIRRETGRLVQIDSQGIADGLPFAFAAEARYIGNCTN